MSKTEAPVVASNELFATPENEREAYEFILRVSKQTPEKPDYWCSCGQCERNESDAEDIIARANDKDQRT